VSSSSGSGSRTRYKDQIHVEGEFGTKTYRRDDEPELGCGDIEYVAVYDGVVNFKDDAVMSPVSVGDSVAEMFRDDVEERLSGVEFKTMEVQ